MDHARNKQFAYHHGRQIGRYQLKELLGRGATAEVYKSTHPELRRDVAVKILHPFLTEDPDFVQRFQHEAQAVASLVHPNIVQVYDFEVTADGLYTIVMQYINGQSLGEYLAQESQPLPLKTAYLIFSQVAKALHFAHQLDIIHRDIKPGNILLDTHDNAYLGDFGFAKIIGVDLQTRSGLTPGTPIYMAPEQIDGSPATVAADIYALGVILYEMLTGLIPYEDDSLMTVILRKISEPPQLPRTYNPDISPELEAVIMKGMERDPVARFSDAATMAAALHTAIAATTESLPDVNALSSRGVFPPPRLALPDHRLKQKITPIRAQGYQQFLARNTTNQQKTTITIWNDPNQADEFLHRAKILHQSDDPHLPKIRQMGRLADARPYLTYDAVAGELLAVQLQASTPQPPYTALTLSQQIGKGVAAVHELGLIHNQLQAENIIVREDDRVLLVGSEFPDYAIAERSRWDNLDAVPPEVRQKKTLTPASNVYSLGILLYEMLAGQRPEVSVVDSFDSSGNFVATAVPLEDVVEGLHPLCYEVVKNCLQPSPQDRYPSLEILLTQLQRVVQAEALAAVTVTARQSEATVESSAVSSIWPIWKIILPAIILLIFLLVAAWGLIPNKSSSSTGGNAPSANIIHKLVEPTGTNTVVPTTTQIPPTAVVSPAAIISPTQPPTASPTYRIRATETPVPNFMATIKAEKAAARPTDSPPTQTIPPTQEIIATATAVPQPTNTSAPAATTVPQPINTSAPAATAVPPTSPPPTNTPQPQPTNPPAPTRTPPPAPTRTPPSP
ncbi:MAG: protein kinase [Chloroflexi bacterium]|nr:protein kinase [Chloroflexota bacterium]